MNVQAKPLIRNAEVELWRFVFACMVFLSHMGVYLNGALAVDFFFLLTGYLAMASIQRAEQRNMSPRGTFDFIIHKIKSFYPELLVATILSIVVYLCAKPIDGALLSQAFKTLINGIIPILKMTGMGISVTDFNGATWFLSSMLIGLLVVYPIIVRVKTKSLLFIAGVLICGFLCQYNGALYYVYRFIGFTYEGNIRAVGELLIGASLYSFVQGFSKVSLTPLVSTIAMLLKFCCLASFLFCMTLDNTQYHGVALCCAIASVVLMFSGQCIDKNIYQNKLFIFLGAFSLPLYISHRALTVCASSLMPVDGLSQSEQVTICFIYSCLAALLVMALGRIIRKYSAPIAKCIFKESKHAEYFDEK